MTIDSGSTAWILISGALATLVAPGFGLFFGGMADKKNILTTIAYCILIFSTAVITWALLGFSFAFGNSTVARGFIGDCSYCWLKGISITTQSAYAPNVPFTALFFFESVVAGLGAVLSILSLIGRIRVAFIIVLTIVYILTIHSIVTYWVRNKEGWLNVFGYIDFGGGSYVHIASGFSSLGAIYYLGQGKLKQYKHTSSSIALTLVGTTIMWLGWFGLNCGGTVSSSQVTALALTNTQLAACGGALAWAFSEYVFTQNPHILGYCSGVICGLTSITSGAGYVSLWSSLVIGAIGGILAYVFSHYKTLHFKENKDSLDIFGCHGIGGAWGGIAVGLFATLDSGSQFTGLFYGNGQLFGQNILGVFVIALYSFFVTWINIFILERLLQMKVPGEEEKAGLDKAAHQDEQPLNKLGIIAELKEYQKSLLGIELIKQQELAVDIKEGGQKRHNGKQIFTQRQHSESEDSSLNQRRKKKQQAQVPQEVIDRLIQERRAKQVQLISLIERHIHKRDQEMKQ